MQFVSLIASCTNLEKMCNWLVQFPKSKSERKKLTSCTNLEEMCNLYVKNRLELQICAICIEKRLGLHILQKTTNHIKYMVIITLFSLKSAARIPNRLLVAYFQRKVQLISKHGQRCIFHAIERICQKSNKIWEQKKYVNCTCREKSATCTKNSVALY